MLFVKVGVVGLMAMAMAVGCGGEGPAEAGPGTQPSVSITIDVPDGAGIDPADVSFEVLSPEDYVGESGEAVAGFELLPDGARFDEPVVVTLVVENPPQGTLGFVHESAGEAEGLSVVDSTFDAAQQTLTVVAELSHFSRVWATSGSGRLPVARLEHPGRVVVGDPFTATLTVTMPERNVWPHRLSEGRFSTSGNLTPSEVTNRPPSTFITTPTFTMHQEFTCTYPDGLNSIWYWADHKYFLNESAYEDNPGDPDWPGWFWIVGANIECVAATPTPRPTDVPDPTPTPSPTKDPLEEFGEVFLQTPTPTPWPTSTPTPTQVPGEPEPISIEPGTVVGTMEVEPGWTIAFMRDGIAWVADRMQVANPDLCDYVHVHGPATFPVTPIEGQIRLLSEDKGACGFGPPNFVLMPIPR